MRRAAWDRLALTDPTSGDAMRTSSRFSRSATACAALLCCAVLLAGCIQIPLGTTTGPSRKVTSSSKGASAPMPSRVAVGMALTSRPWKVIVRKASLSSKGSAGRKAPAGKAFVRIETEFQNIDMGNAVIVRPEDAVLEDSSGRRFSLSGTDPGYNARGMRPIAPRMGGFTVFVFAVPKGVSNLTFTFRPSVAGKRLKLSWGVL